MPQSAKFQVAADDGAEAFAAAVADYGAPAVLAGGEFDGIDAPAYVHYPAVMKAMKEKVGVHLTHVSFADDDGVNAHHAPVSERAFR
ncbi:hypothetical protein CYMTET_43869 [Cymbomonas tetramitiformis]|uniref:Uncharacterized protein n=1 Tax=Cymbomonas tetramitiformis TaxID=36881 RepID=A0AAE0C2G8_9CHLO|nr:hypothetical protein CYMTET_43870 [Cymbomonas tetramitiformis]KAK3246601.1 hypothetical protein CYMTET_43869 [Cymbomonas tetramitiformis]